jgi:hypothetical protein
MSKRLGDLGDGSMFVKLQHRSPFPSGISWQLRQLRIRLLCLLSAEPVNWVLVWDVGLIYESLILWYGAFPRDVEPYASAA